MPLAVYLDVSEPDVGDGPGRLRDAGFEVRIELARTPGEVVAAAVGADVVLVGDTPLTAEALAGLPGLRGIALVTAGVDQVDLEAARAHGVWVSNVPAASTEEVAVHALAMSLSLVRHLPFFDRHVRGGGWDFAATGRLRRPSSLALGVVGLGRIGSRVAELARPLFRAVVACDPAVSPGAGPAGVELDSLDGLLARCDVVTLHVPLVPATSGLIDARRLASMPEGAYLVNVARGGLVDLDALLAELDRGRLAGAALDVLPAEPPPAGAAVVRHPRVMLTPHVGFLSAEAVRDSATRQVENVLAWARGGRALDVVVEGAA
jgi:D-3-phosphoglycerate dehydrogenase